MSDDPLAALSPARRELVRRRLAARAGAGPVAGPRDGRPAPLSFAQERLWVTDQFLRGTSYFTMSEAIWLQGPLDERALERSVSDVLRRHDVLRSTIRWIDGGPCQMAAPAAPFLLPIIDLTALPPAEREAAALERARLEALRPFSLARGPLFRATLVRLTEERRLLLLALHHIVADGWSAAVLLGELAHHYARHTNSAPTPGQASGDALRTSGTSLALPDLPIQYADFAVWQRRTFTMPDNQRLAYWRERLSGPPPAPLAQPAAGAAGPSAAPIQHEFGLPAEQAERLARFAGAAGTTPFVVLATAVAAVLHRLSDGGTVRLATHIANRGSALTEGLIGLVANTVVLSSDAPLDLPVAALLGRMRATVLDALDHGDVPYELLVAHLTGADSGAAARIAPVLLLYHDQRAPLPGFGAVTATIARPPHDPAPRSVAIAAHELVVEARHEPNGLHLTATAPDGRFSGATLAGLLRALSAALAALFATPWRTIASLPGVELAP